MFTLLALVVAVLRRPMADQTAATKGTALPLAVLAVGEQPDPRAGPLPVVAVLVIRVAQFTTWVVPILVLSARLGQVDLSG